MNKRWVKKIAAAVLAGSMALSMAACAAQEAPEPAPADDGSQQSAGSAPAESGSPVAPAVAELSAEDYKAKVESLMAEIAAVSQSALQQEDITDGEAMIKATSDMVAQVKPMYEELSGLEAPAEYADAHAKIKTGVDASLEVLDLSLEMMETGGDENKVAELQGKVAELTAVAQDLNAGLAMLSE